MKRRNGFVSNSSSSSFIVALDDMELTEGNVRDSMFGDKDSTLYEYGSEMLSTDSLARMVFNEMKESTPSEDELVEELSNNEYDYEESDALQKSRNVSDFPRNTATDEERDIWRKASRECYEEYDKITKGRAEIKLQELLKEHKNLVLIEFSDNDGTYSCHLEHSGIITDSFTAIRISKH